MTLKNKAKRLKQDIPAVMIALHHPDTPVIAKILAGMTVCYALSPVDLIPDFIPLLGYLDDVLVLPAMIVLTVKCIPQDVWKQCLIHADTMSRKQKRWYYAIPVVLIWMMIIVWIVKVLI